LRSKALVVDVLLTAFTTKCLIDILKKAFATIFYGGHPKTFPLKVGRELKRLRSTQIRRFMHAVRALSASVKNGAAS